MNNIGWKINKNIKFRREFFGGYCWTDNDKFFKLNHIGISIIELFSKPTLMPNEKLSVLLNDFDCTFRSLTEKKILIETNEKSKSLHKADFDSVLMKTNENSKRTILKPHWVHIQPFIYCNQRCIHCYCEADDTKNKFPLGVGCWKDIIDYLDSYGIWEIYITGGENFIVPECFELTSYIIKKKIKTGISTNGMHVTDEILGWLRDNGIKRIQVSLDGSHPNINDRIRGVRGAFEKTMAGLSKLSDYVCPVINTVINKINFNDLESIIKMCHNKGVKDFKFYPQKSSGRGASKYLLSDIEKSAVEKRIKKYRDQYQINIDWPDTDNNCGAGIGGFAINEDGDVYPCIFGVSNKSQKLSSIFKYDIDSFWFDSPKLNFFRSLDSMQICRRCEKDLSEIV